MPLLRAAARPMLASIFILEGLDKLRHPEKVSEAAEPIVAPLAKRIEAIPNSTEQAVRINGAVQLGAGLMLATGRFPRVAAFALAATLVPTTAAGHRFWEAQDKQEKDNQRVHLLKNVALLGGLLIASADTAGQPGLAWRTQHAAGVGKHVVRASKRDAKLAAKAAKATGSAKAAKAAARAQRASRKATAKAAKASLKTTAKASRSAGKVQGQTAHVVKQVQDTAAQVAGRVSDALPTG